MGAVNAFNHTENALFPARKEIERLREAGKDMLDHIVRSDPPDMGDINKWGALLDGSGTDPKTGSFATSLEPVENGTSTTGTAPSVAETRPETKVGKN